MKLEKEIKNENKIGRVIERKKCKDSKIARITKERKKLEKWERLRMKPWWFYQPYFGAFFPRNKWGFNIENCVHSRLDERMRVWSRYRWSDQGAFRRKRTIGTAYNDCVRM